jgi:transketolase
MATIDVKLLGRDMTPAAGAYFTTPTAETSTGLLAGPQGILIAQGAAIANAHRPQLHHQGQHERGEQVVGSTTYADITEGRVLVDGQITALFDSA